jgi:predicted metal-dependent phosphoesterase TrpH
MGKADLHIHTTHSWDGTTTVSAVLKQVVAHTDLNVIAITDHDEISGALEALELAPTYGIDVIPGSEISTADGHLLALFIEHKIPAGLSLNETVLRVGALGGLCIAPHISARGASSLTPVAVRLALRDPDLRRILVGIEVFNAGLVPKTSNRVAQELADDLPVAQVGNSDAHMLWMIGRGATGFTGWTPADLRLALETHRTYALASGAACSSTRLIGDWVSGYLLRRAGWVTGNEGPHAPIRFGRMDRVDFKRSQANYR